MKYIVLFTERPFFTTKKVGIYLSFQKKSLAFQKNCSILYRYTPKHRQISRRLTVKTTISETPAKERAAAWSLIATFLLTALKLVAGLVTGSLAILSEALHSAVDLLATGITWAAVRFAAKPADAVHSYGHARMENLSALAESLLLLMVCGFVLTEGLERLSDPHPVTVAPAAAAIMLLSLCIDINRVRTLKRVAKETKSQALEADAMHFATDILSTTAVLLGLCAIAVAEHIPLSPGLASVLSRGDAIAALLVCAVIATVAAKMAWKACGVLLDASPAGLRERVEEILRSTGGVTDVPRLRIRSAGATCFIDAVIRVPGHLAVVEAHAICDAAEKAISALIPDSDVSLHVAPAE